MNSITVVADTIVKAIVTESLRKESQEALLKAINDLEQSKSQCAFQKQYFLKKLENDPDQLKSVLFRLDNMVKDIDKKRKTYQERLQEVLEWKLGQEVIKTKVQSLLELNIGDQFSEAITQEIILKDGVVVEIRNVRGL